MMQANQAHKGRQTANGLRRLQVGAAIAALAVVAGCTMNTAPGNDEEAASSPRPPPAEVAEASRAVHETDVAAVKPHTMTRDEYAKVVVGPACGFTMTAVGRPVLLVSTSENGPSAGKAVMKFNGKLVALQTSEAAEQSGESSGPTVSATDIEARVSFGPDDDTGDARREAALLLTIGGAEEQGYQGYYRCDFEVAGEAAEPSVVSAPRG